MILTGHQPVYLPWLGLFHKMVLSDVFISMNRVQYQANDWNNRNQVKTVNGPVWLTVPVHAKGRLNGVISDIRIDNEQPWAKRHLRTLEQSYARSPYFDHYRDELRAIYLQTWVTLEELNDRILEALMGWLGIRTPIKRMSEGAYTGHKGDLVLDMCRQSGAEAFVFGEQGRGYVDCAAFVAAGVNPVFQAYQHPEYPQQHGPFVPNLSVIDLLANCGEDSLSILLDGNLTRDEIAGMA